MVDVLRQGARLGTRAFFAILDYCGIIGQEYRGEKINKK